MTHQILWRMTHALVDKAMVDTAPCCFLRSFRARPYYQYPVLAVQQVHEARGTVPWGLWG